MTSFSLLIYLRVSLTNATELFVLGYAVETSPSKERGGDSPIDPFDVHLSVWYCRLERFCCWRTGTCAHIKSTGILATFQGVGAFCRGRKR